MLLATFAFMPLSLARAILQCQTRSASEHDLDALPGHRQPAARHARPRADAPPPSPSRAALTGHSACPGQPPRDTEVVRDAQIGCGLGRPWHRDCDSSPAHSGLEVAERTGTMGDLARCVIWGDDRLPRRRLGADAPGTADRSLQGTAASAAVPFYPSVMNR